MNDSYNLYTKYQNNCISKEWAMDGRHIMILYNILLRCNFKRVLEIGSHFGCSTTAFVEAKKNTPSLDVHVCDIEIQSQIIEICREYKIETHEMRSSEYLPVAPQFDFVLLDGSHISEDVQDEFEYLSLNHTDTYLLHDTNTQLLPESINTPWFDGPLFLMNKLKSSKDWFWIEDCEERREERTNRGVFFATKNICYYNIAKDIFNYWSSLSLYEINTKLK